MTHLTRLLGCSLLSAFALYACGDDGSTATRGAAGQDGDDASAGKPAVSTGGSNRCDTNNAGGDSSLGGTGSAGEAPQGAGGSGEGGTGEGGAAPATGEGGAAPATGEGGAGGASEAATGGAGGASTCELGEAASAATNQALDLFGTIVYFNDGAELPAGRYRISYLDGCMKYAGSQDWTVHAYANGASAAWWLVGADSSQRIVVPPGTSGYATSNGAHATFDACVAANLELPPVELDFEGGKLGVWLLDSLYSDNIAGEEGRNPKWKLTLLADCVE